MIFLLFPLPFLIPVLLILKGLEGLKEGFAALFVKDGGNGDEFSSIIPLVIPEKDMESVKLEDFDACIKIAGCVCTGTFSRTESSARLRTGI